MAKFKYRMQNILDVKLKLESQAKITYGIANQKYMAEQQKLQEIVLRRNNYEKAWKECMTGTIDVRQVAHARADVNTMKTLMRRQMMEVHKAELELEDARRALNEVMQERKMHEKLKERAFEQFQQELKAEESKEIDQLVSYTYGKK
ncbi:MAG: flagellar export protein FliJ [Agathobacter sp.]|nr:flagellar export protein FliJ [Agathobacter sp.]MBQ6812655.1 flagellar export protein FliJ [Agathobacter sp.]